MKPDRTLTIIVGNGVFAIILMLVMILGFNCAYRQLHDLDHNLSKMQRRYETVTRENEMLWRYIENVDTFKSLDDAVERRDSLIDQLQFLDE